MAVWSEHIPLNIAGNDISVLGQLLLNTRRRFESVHLYDIASNDLGPLRSTVIREISSPSLRSLSLFSDFIARVPVIEDSARNRLPLTPEHAPNLRFFALDDVELLPANGFSCLTHLALIDSWVYTSWSTAESPENFHSRLLKFLKECPRLESIVLMNFVLRLAEGEVLREPAPLPLPHLQHVTLCNFDPEAIRYYVSLLQPRVDGSSIQILGYHPREPWFPGHFLLPPDSTRADAQALKQICVGVHTRAPHNPEYSISVTTVSSSSTRRLVARSSQLADTITPYDWPSSILSQPPTASLPLPMEEVWLYGFSGTTIPRIHSPLLHLPHITRVLVLATDRRLHYDDSDIPTLRHLPTALDLLPGPISISAVRIVYGFSEPSEPFRERSPFDWHGLGPAVNLYHLPLVQLVDDLRSGAYAYLKHFVLQATPHMWVSEDELAAVREAGRFETFVFEHIATFPEMPGHSDPARKERFPNPRW
ncbi:hypothetical protein GSI_07842 [Ganoderma sinense ZZ0214-1]|uniref:F-box domain-containing protein n=1 Tax=Ganoderma sinense ZZ0214-1 TaxID=1077348 RepID=A0A2G8S846_9APHY|nr:hypothetical protein GSI_07842 [Ganoderma sinense ZZ0214-1]